MNYKESKKILQEIQKAEKILLMCHTSPDEDSIVSCLIMEKALQWLGKKVEIFSADKLHKHEKVLDSDNHIQISSLKAIDFKSFDLFFVLDASGPNRMGINFELPESLKVINVDHHDSREDFYIQIKDHSKSSTSEILYYLLEDFGYKFETKDVNLILTGIISDTDMFQYGAFPDTFRTVAKLIELGGDLNSILVQLWRSYSLERFKFLSEMLSEMKLDKKNKFAYTALPYERFIKYKDLFSAKRDIADHFIRNIENTNFGIVMIESQKNNLGVSVRARSEGFRVLDIVEDLGGGGYISGGGALVKNMPFDKAVNKVLKVARKYAKKD